MSYGGSNQPRPSRNERREAAREKARVLREEQKKRERRNKLAHPGRHHRGGRSRSRHSSHADLPERAPRGSGPGEHGERRHRAHRRRRRRHRRRRDARRSPRVRRRPRPCPTTAARSPTSSCTSTTSARSAAQFEADELRVAAHDGRVGRRDARDRTPSPSSRTSRRARSTRCAPRTRRPAWPTPRPTRSSTSTTILFENQPEEGTDGLTNDELEGARRARPASRPLDDRAVHRRRAVQSWVQDATNRALTQPVPNSELAVDHRHADRARERQAVRRLARGPAGVPGVRAAGDERDVQRLRVDTRRRRRRPPSSGHRDVAHEGPAPRRAFVRSVGCRGGSPRRLGAIGSAPLL